MGRVNLFYAKLSKQDIKEVETDLMNLNRNIAHYIRNLKMDSFGVEILRKVHDKECKIKQQIEILKKIIYVILPERFH